MPKKKDIHVVPHPDGGLATRREGSDRVSSRHPTQREAIEQGRDRARLEKSLSLSSTAVTEKSGTATAMGTTRIRRRIRSTDRQ